MVLVLFSGLIPANLTAQPTDTPVLGIGLGYAGILDEHKTGLLSLEYRPAIEKFHLRPWIGTEFGYKLFYFAGGILAHLQVGDALTITPSFGVGFYSTESGIELGHSLEFRSALELGYHFPNRHILGISFGHISNGGLAEKNPGSEILKISYYFPLQGM